MNKIKLLVFIITVIILAGLSGWFARSIWDSVFYLHGRVHIVSNLPTKAAISLVFPSGEKKNLY